MEDVPRPHKVTDYSSSSEESGTTDEDDDEEVDQEGGEESTSGPEDSRAVYVLEDLYLNPNPIPTHNDIILQ